MCRGTTPTLGRPSVADRIDSTTRRVASLIYDMVERAYDYPRPEPPTVWCRCLHSDDEHYGERGEKHCSMCGCGEFVEVTA